MYQISKPALRLVMNAKLCPVYSQINSLQRQTKAIDPLRGREMKTLQYASRNPLSSSSPELATTRDSEEMGSHWHRSWASHHPRRAMCSILLIQNAHDRVICLLSTQVDCREVPGKVLLEVADSLM